MAVGLKILSLSEVTTPVGTMAIGIADSATTNVYITIANLQKLWVTNVDANGNNLVNMGILSFDDTNTTIIQVGTDLRYGVATGGFHDFLINGAVEFSIGISAINFINKNLTNVGLLQFDNANTNINQFSADLRYNVATGGTHDFRINNVLETRLDIVSLDIGTKAIVFQDDTGDPTVSTPYINWNALNMQFNVPTGDGFRLRIQGAEEFLFTLSGLDIQDKDLDGVQNVIHGLSTSGTDVDFNENELQEISIITNTTFTGTNYATGKTKVIKITTDGTLRTLAFPPAWVFIGSAAPADQAANKEAILSLTCFSGVEAGVIASYAVEP